MLPEVRQQWPQGRLSFFNGWVNRRCLHHPLLPPKVLHQDFHTPLGTVMRLRQPLLPLFLRPRQARPERVRRRPRILLELHPQPTSIHQSHVRHHIRNHFQRRMLRANRCLV